MSYLDLNRMTLSKTNRLVPKEEQALACSQALFQALQTDPRHDRDNLIQRKGTRVDHTCTWITSNQFYKSWLDSCPQLLWLSGGPGKGKTMISIFLAEHLERMTEILPDAVSLEYFCDNKNDRRNTADSIIQGLLFQVLQKRPELINHILPTFEIQQASLFSGSSFESLWRIFVSMTCDPMLRTIYCVLDGLDECDKHSLEVLLRHFKALFSTNSSDTPSCRLNLIAVSRDLPDIIPELLSGFPRIRLDQDTDIEVSQDITRFIDAKLDDIFSVKKYPQSTRVRVKEIFMERAQGTFLWIGIAAKTLEECNAIEFEAVLERLPPGLEKLYDRILLDIKVNHRQIAARILRWVVMAVRPFTLSELSAIIEPTIEPPTGFTREDVTERQVSYCGCFLTIDNCKVNLIHQSAKDYLLRGDYDNSNLDLKDFRMEEKGGNQEIARKCFLYLEDNLLASDDMGPWERREAFPLLSYATRYWHIHARFLPSSDDIFKLSRPFYGKDSQIRKLWLRSHHKLLYFPYPSRFPYSSKPLHMASHFDILPLAEALLDQGGLMKMIKCFRSINEKDSGYKTALHWAAQNGHLAIARLLLGKGANVNAKDKKKETALHKAARHGHRELVQLLLENGADINMKNHENETVLHRAAWSRHEGLVRLLLEKGADINAKTRTWGKTALHWAADSGHEGVVRILLEEGADINAKDDLDYTPLHRAAGSGYEGVVRLLLEEGADIKVISKHVGTALHCAARYGHTGLVRLLLDMGAHIDAKDNDDKTSMQTAAAEGREGAVRLLLDRGADVNAKDKSGTTALHYVAKSGHEGVMLLLLDMGADIDAKDIYNGTALNKAIYRGYEGAVRLLLDRGADINVKDIDGMTALHRAAMSKDEGVLLLVLNRGAHIDAKDNDDETALHIAAQKGYKEAVRLLLDREADFNVKNIWGWTALDVASNKAVIQLLRDMGEASNDAAPGSE